MATKSYTKILEPNIRLLVTKGNDQGRVYESNRFPFIIGRDPGADFQLKSDNNISRNHTKLSADEEGTVWIEDLGSTNGCFVNNVRIQKKTELKQASTIIIGSTWLKFIIFTPGIPEKELEKQLKNADSSTFFTETKKVEAILILDISDSSRLANTYGDEIALELTETLNAITSPVFNKFGCEFHKGTGDGFLVTFKNPVDSLDAALEIFKKVKIFNANKKNKVKMHIRICLNYGQCTIEPDGDRHGNAVNVAFRVEGVRYRDIKKEKDSIAQKDFPEKDRIFITEDFYNKLAGAKRNSFMYMGSFKLKGISELCPVYSRR
jgi:class 3 adenylate cyclase